MEQAEFDVIARKLGEINRNIERARRNMRIILGVVWASVLIMLAMAWMR